MLRWGGQVHISLGRGRVDRRLHRWLSGACKGMVAGGLWGMVRCWLSAQCRCTSADVGATEREPRGAQGRAVRPAGAAGGGGGHMVVVLDSEYVFKGVIEWSPKWKRHSWRSKSTEIGHQDLWQEIWQLHAAGCMAAGADNLDCLGHLCGEGGTAWTSSHRPAFV